MKQKLLLSFFLFLMAAGGSAQSGEITVTSVQQRSDGSGLVDVFYNLSGSASAYNISMQASFDGGSNYTPIPPAFLSGDIAGITLGSNKHIVWDGLGSFPNTFSTLARLELTATEVTGGGTPCPGMPTFTDSRDGQTYNTVQIGDQCWMAENLKYLPSVVGPGTGSYTVPYYYVYGYNGTNVNAAKATANYQNYGALYNWPASLTACPPGWHLPSDAEWTQLTNYVVSQGYPNNWNDPNGAGNALKSCRQVNSPLGGDCNTSEHPRWDSHITHHGFDEFGFSAFPGGYRYTNGDFYDLGCYGPWWSSSEISSTRAWGRSMYYSDGNVNRYSNNEGFGFSVRCLRD
jgi:uncharacterized protein (TIGR02145 family)